MQAYNYMHIYVSLRWPVTSDQWSNQHYFLHDSQITETKQRLLEEINSIDYPGGETYTAKGIDLMLSEVIANANRPQARKLSIVITDGDPTEGSADPIPVHR